MQSSRIENLKCLASELLHKSGEDDTDDTAVKSLALTSQGLYASPTQQQKQACGVHSMKHELKNCRRCGKICLHLYISTSLHIDATDQLFEQSLNQRLFENILLFLTRLRA